ncbi:DNA gyrase/topoisomerase IV subunit A [Mycoplasmopsis pullorum]|uniref:DNA topoisomerase (ATP-hydrolyzing) n=1 Tax=Mycoplasmopsis pullorum TaxID=48003 RepID=A0A1L4FRU9_9BACT|nr:DNA topoisomerase IV subunit A [Mycoplasmopsis pullorum]APJ38322.1 DNA topoisomerase IV [Mycoplasmopsis pullorum]AXX39456.1 DNA topoisomerase IV subunit A [Mycoplasmopsis pullorum]AXX39457.1 DNA topoisomerase IV subunit A [Mycoplasmopsis pullorum]AXX39458.1 DNA topoisomerase IV subunit A [Mycoplasmopsis pullorum]AXX39465.1 DNA topoisomerase IV subunit A [Mycoplasmopsis pullorum]
MEKEKIISKIINESLDKIMANRFERYSKYVIQQRALPDARDGLKPVQRRILFSMHELGFTHNRSYEKSARVVGDVIGKYHPHGDSSIYEAMVNMSQWWKSNIPLLDMQGNIGSLDNDPAAAMRYTEIRMAKIAQYVLSDLDKNTVTFVPNFDDKEKEPVVLPSIFPTLLVNGATGIAIGMATDMPPHNFEEIMEATIAKLQNPEISLKSLLKIVKGPDFPTGGVIYGTEGVHEALELGKLQKNKIKLFAKYNIITSDKNKVIEITEIPYGVVKSELVYSIDLIINNKDVDGILEIKDHSDREGIKIVITLEVDANEKSILNYLFAKTKLQVNINYDNIAIYNNSPKLMNLNQLLDAYIEHVKNVQTKAITYDLEKFKLRLEIVLGFLKVTEITDEVIRVIRKSEGSKAGVIEDLMKYFQFTKNQATAIAELRLYRLSKTDKEEVLKEKAELEEKIAYLSSLLDDEAKFVQYLIYILEKMKNEFPCPRKTQIVANELSLNYDEKDLIKEEIINIGISRHGYIKRLSQKVIDSNDFATYQLKDDDYLTFWNKVNTLDTFLIFTSFGNYAIIPIYKIAESKWKDLGVHLTDFVDLKPGEQVVSVIEIQDWNSNNFIVISTKNGMIKKTPVKDFEVSRLIKTYTAIKISDDDEVVNACISDGTKDVIFVTKNGLFTKYSENEVNIYGTKAKGIKGIYLSTNDYVVSFTTAQHNDVLTLITHEGLIKKIRTKDMPYVSKNNKGKELFKNKKNDPHHVVEIYATRDTDMLLLRDSDGNSYLDPVKQYLFSKTDDTFYNVNISNFVAGVIRKTQKVTNKDTSFETKFENKKTKENDEKVFAEAEKKISTIDEDLNELLRKVNFSLKEKTKNDKNKN